MKMSGIDFLRIREKTFKLNLVLKTFSKFKVARLDFFRGLPPKFEH